MDKQDVRERVWDELAESGEARFPYPPHGRIPNFNGADEAAERLAATEAWREADAIKSNPDAPQLPVRRAALRQEKTVYMAVPRLREEKCFLRLDPAEIDDYDHATTIGGSAEVGVQVAPEEMDPIDLIVSGSVAVDESGGRIGKGEGYSDLEFALLRECGLVSDETVTATTVHEMQVVDDDVDAGAHDVPIDLIVTPERTVRDEVRAKPSGVRWAELSEERIEEIPILRRLRPE
ncbi:5-formyltetrahydrofolate cyclo-ligase [Halopelagius longus]|uniref:5-formyltetrahydrofolate cyclo-ligase n=1 Tax=Halopelagius longus TaxID=1236180 RepID=A0A1H0XX98_9EURY|nr:5-formyltetrahydrofolate cyclo-ligase [Halopelagius longus]RDI72148.1 5-formyltetrahydrofolate cyclo-ligase [Halopelagius longus]SDQ07465.1 5-formyltetrahydrofolate cyclo-ligase [Halopelagius longus]